MSMLTYTRLLTIPPQYEDDENREIIPLNRLIRLDSRRPLNIKALDNMEKSMNREWTYINVTKTAEGLAQLKDDQNLMEELFRQDQVMIMMGTNDIRKATEHKP